MRRSATRDGVGARPDRIEQQNKLVSAQPSQIIVVRSRHRVPIANGACQLRGKLDQDLVAGRMSKTVVNHLEPVEIDKDHGKGFVR